MMQDERTSSSSVHSGDDMGTKSRLLVPLDGSELAAKALPVVEYLCRQLAAELDLVSVLPAVVLPLVAGQEYIPAEVYQQLEAQQQQDARTYLDHVTTELRQHGVGA